MNNLMDSISSGSKALSDEELMELLLKVRSGELSPEQAERLLGGLPGLEGTADPGPSGWTEQTSERDASAHQTEGHEASAPLGQAIYVTLMTVVYAAAQFLAAPWLGRLSDRYGRKPVLLFCLSSPR